MKTIKLIIASIVFVLFAQFSFVAISLDEGELKAPKTPIEEIMTWDSDKATEYLSNPDNYSYYNGLFRVFYLATSSPKYFWLNTAFGLLQVWGGILIYRFLGRSRNAI